MKKIKKNRKKAGLKLAKSLKMSEMIISFAGDFIQMGNTIDEKQNYLNVACIAWNISLLPLGKRQGAIDLFISDYELANPEIADAENLRHDINQLIEGKNRLFPTMYTQIVRAEIIEVGGEERIKVASLAI
jgi:hypothetical protein